MASPIKTTIVNALRALAKIKSKDEWIDNIKEGDSNQVKAIKLEAQFKRLEEEINKAEANIEDIRLSLSSWTDLLRKIPSDERQMANDEYEAFQKTQKLEASMEAIDTMLRQLKDFKDEVSIKAKVAMAKSDKELKEEEMKHSQKMQSTSAQSSGTPQIAATTISSVYQLPTLQIKPFNGNRKDWVEFYESFKCAVDSGNGSDVEKLTLLRNLVDGEAKELIAGFRLEAKSYKEALQMLKDNYGDKDAYIRSLHTRLTNLKACVTLGDVRRFSIELERLARELQNSGEDIEGPSVYLALEKKLNKPFLRTILSKRSEGNNWSTTQFREALRETIQKEMAIQEVMNEYEREVPRRPNRMSFQPNQRGNQFQRRSAPTQNQRQDFTYATLAQGQQIKPNQIRRSSSRRPRVSTTNQSMDKQSQPTWKCAFCDELHFNDRCVKYSTPQERLTRAKEKKLCTRCLRKAHTSFNCPKPSMCFHCKRMHPSALCFVKMQNRYAQRQENVQLPKPGGQNSTNNRQPEQANAVKEEGSKSVLMTLPAVVCNPKRPQQKEEALIFLDAGSQRSFISAKLANKLQLPIVSKEKCHLTSFGDRCSKTYDSDLVRLNIYCADGQKLSVVLNKLGFLVNPLPCFNVREIDPMDLQREKITPSSCKQPDILLGVDLWHELNIQQLKRLPSGFTISDSKLGKILSGAGQMDEGFATHTIYAASVQVNVVITEERPCIACFTNVKENNDWPTKSEWPAAGTCIHSAEEKKILNEEDIIVQSTLDQNKSIEEDNMTINDREAYENLATFFGLHSIGMDDTMLPEDKDEVMQNFKKNLTFVDGRYQISLPFNSQIHALPTNYRHAKMRLSSTLKKLRQINAIDQYQAILDDQLAKGVIEVVKNPNESTGPVHYLPHRAVVREDKNTTKLRIVMDASARPPSQRSAPSLNNCLHTGPLLLKQLVGILLRFRLMDRVILADIEKAFLQLGVRETDRDCTRFLWVNNPKDVPLENFQYAQCIVYRFCRVSFGLTVSPFLLNATIREHLSLFDSPVARTIEENLYVDNIMIQVKEGENAKQMCLESIEIFQSGGMTLREFSGLLPNELKGFPEENLATDQNNVKILGIPWIRENDTIILKLAKFNGKPTKRTLLSTIAKVYDPLGLVSPIVLQAKFILQRVFEANYKWDAPLDDKLSEDWLKLMELWSTTSEITIPRLIKNNPKKELHCFTDASGQGFGAAAYLRTFNAFNGGTTKLIFAKSLVKPASLPHNASTIPKLELQALTLGAKIIRYLQKELIIEANSITLWSDSQCNIERLKKFGKYDRFVNNRLAKIRDLCPVKHVTTEDNPADFCSRGSTPKELIGNGLWFRGPIWLQYKEENWPTPLVIYQPGQELNNKEENDIEIQAVIEEQIPEGIIDVLRFSKYKKLISTLAYVFKFTKKMKKLIHPEESEIVQNEKKMKDLKEAERYLIKTTQARHPPTKDVISSLKMYKTIDGTWRCKGRLDESEAKSEAKNPIFLPRESWVTKLLILDLHLENKHCGSSTLLAILRQIYWIQRGRRTIENTICSNKFGCLMCRKFKLRPYSLRDFDNLPRYRINVARPFLHCGVDYFGPMNVKGQTTTEKVYGALFTCLTIRAIHLEMATDASAETFLQAYRRFIARRGTPSIMVSDNATNFTLGSKIIKKMNWDLYLFQGTTRLHQIQGHRVEIHHTTQPKRRRCLGKIGWRDKNSIKKMHWQKTSDYD
uniref:DUF1758 domain-containing protein n=1 Tax=Meloidogyne enterolobii TaxID=390850 RepID=A0A6V7X397_MELEN|nr:unnamed protein product [Meloidogyne enterolobii]